MAGTERIDSIMEGSLEVAVGKVSRVKGCWTVWGEWSGHEKLYANDGPILFPKARFGLR